ncbi:MAG: molecular chaperone TorD family protein [Betaproteobacteria bacterium]|nr:molecular chaperone TorD family protein [Betaproteobacteria bacterium]
MADDDEEKARARENLCRFLAACYYEPGPEFAEEKLFDAMLDAAGRIGPDLAARAHRLREAFAAESHENLLVDYARLFLGPVDAIAKPYGSVWLEGEKSLMQGSTHAVIELYGEGGFEIAEDFRELPDHVAAELEFLYLLIFRANVARRLGDDEAVRAVAGLRRRFLDEHLGRWVAPFAAAVRAGAQSAFYRELAGLTERFVRMEVGADKEQSRAAGVSPRTG